MKILSLLKGFSGTEARPRDEEEISRSVIDPL